MEVLDPVKPRDTGRRDRGVRSVRIKEHWTLRGSARSVQTEFGRWTVAGQCVEMFDPFSPRNIGRRVEVFDPSKPKEAFDPVRPTDVGRCVEVFDPFKSKDIGHVWKYYRSVRALDGVLKCSTRSSRGTLDGHWTAFDPLKCSIRSNRRTLDGVWGCSIR